MRRGRRKGRTGSAASPIMRPKMWLVTLAGPTPNRHHTQDFWAPDAVLLVLRKNPLDTCEQKENKEPIIEDELEYPFPPSRYPQCVPRLSSNDMVVGASLKGSIPMSLLPLLASLVMAGAGCAAVTAIFVTVQAQLPAVLKLLADSRAIAADREFLVQVTAASAPAGPRALVRPLRAAVRGLRSGPVTNSVANSVASVVASSVPLRAAA